MDIDRTLSATVSAGIVRVGVDVATSAEEVWSALVEPSRLSRWFGELDEPWQSGRVGQIDFGDGDFFVVKAIEIVPARLLAFEWSFLGVGPVQQIRWEVTARAGQTHVAVEDADPTRSAAEADQMVDGWTDFLSRLVGYLVTGAVTRYDWRADIDGSTDLPAGLAPLHMDHVYRWLPVASDGFEPRWFFIVDDEGPRRFRIDDWALQSGRKLTFSVVIPDAEVVTACTVETLQVSDEQIRLRFAHTGWDRLGLPGDRGRQLRRRFAATWIAAMEQAKSLGSVADGQR